VAAPLVIEPDDDDVPLPVVLGRKDLVATARDEDLLRDWSHFEFYVDGGRVARWENYREAALAGAPDQRT
jgi:hypothetical protein